MKRLIALLSLLVLLVSVLGQPSPSMAGPAPGISSVGIYAVHSAKSPNWVFPSPGQYATSGEGGAWVVVVTAEMGYGTPQAATINGVPGAEITQNRTPIVQGNTIVGYYRYWAFQNGNVNGQFVYTVRSINTSVAKTAWIYIW